MLSKFKTSWLLFERSLQVLSDYRKLLVFPVLTFMATVVIFGFFFGAFLFQPTGYAYTDKAHWLAVGRSVFTEESLTKSMARETNSSSTPGKHHRKKSELQLNRSGMIGATVLYFLAMFLATFFNVAFYHEIIEALNGRSVGVAQGMRFAFSRIQAIFYWSMFAGIVGTIIKMLEQRSGLIGKITMKLIGLAWSVAAVFAIPVIITEETAANPFTVLQNSAVAIKKTWGETLIGFVGLQFGTFLIVMGSMIPFFLVAVFGHLLHAPALMVAAMLGWFVFVTVFIYIAGVASNVFHCALYMFSSSGTIPPGYTREMMDLPWKQRG